jgi:hypothetical protein
MKLPSGTAARSDQRSPFQCPVQISWQTRSGETACVRGSCVDLSPHGARVICDQPIDLRSNVFVQSPGHGQLGNASVRHCSRFGMKYSIGLLFSSTSSQADEGRKRCIRAMLAAGEEPAGP